MTLTNKGRTESTKVTRTMVERLMNGVGVILLVVIFGAVLLVGPAVLLWNLAQTFGWGPVVWGTVGFLALAWFVGGRC